MSLAFVQALQRELVRSFPAERFSPADLIQRRPSALPASSSERDSVALRLACDVAEANAAAQQHLRETHAALHRDRGNSCAEASVQRSSADGGPSHSRPENGLDAVTHAGELRRERDSHDDPRGGRSLDRIRAEATASADAVWGDIECTIGAARRAVQRDADARGALLAEETRARAVAVAEEVVAWRSVCARQRRQRGRRLAGDRRTATHADIPLAIQLRMRERHDSQRRDEASRRLDARAAVVAERQQAVAREKALTRRSECDAWAREECALAAMAERHQDARCRRQEQAPRVAAALATLNRARARVVAADRAVTAAAIDQQREAHAIAQHSRHDRVQRELGSNTFCHSLPHVLDEDTSPARRGDLHRFAALLDPRASTADDAQRWRSATPIVRDREGRGAGHARTPLPPLPAARRLRFGAAGASGGVASEAIDW
jgi:hypothetical protein